MPSTKRVSHRGSLLKGVAVYRVLYQSILNAKLTGRKNLGRKRCSVKIPQSVMIWAAMSSAGVGPVCFLSPQSTQPSTRKF